jgi:hypothetical protein
METVAEHQVSVVLCSHLMAGGASGRAGDGGSRWNFVASGLLVWK